MNITALHNTLTKFFRSGADGITINLDGTEFVPCEHAPCTTDVVTLHSAVVEAANRGSVTGGVIRGLVTEVAFILGGYIGSIPEPRKDRATFTFGLFWLDNARSRFSVDVNVLVSDELRNSTLAFAKRNGQQAIGSLRLGKAIEAGGSGDAGGVPPSKWSAVAARLREGGYGQLAPSVTKHFSDITASRFIGLGVDACVTVESQNTPEFRYALVLLDTAFGTYPEEDYLYSHQEWVRDFNEALATSLTEAPEAIREWFRVRGVAN